MEVEMAMLAAVVAVAVPGAGHWHGIAIQFP